MKGVTLPYRIHLSKLLNSVGRLYIVSEALHFKWKKGLMFVGFSRDDKHISENTVNIALRTMGYDTKKHGFRTMACSALIESGLWSRDAVEKQMSHQERNSVRAAYIHKAEHLEERKLMLQWWANYLDTCKDTIYLCSPGIATYNRIALGNVTKAICHIS